MEREDYCVTVKVDGEDVEFSFLDTVTLDGVSYFLFEEEESDACLILRAVGEDEETYTLEIEEDEEVLRAVEKSLPKYFEDTDSED